MVEDGVISVTCEFCNRKYVFAPAEVDAGGEGAARTASMVIGRNDQLSVRLVSGPSSENAGMSISKRSPSVVTMP